MAASNTETMDLFALPKNIFRFYRDGFREMTWGRTLWIIIIAKLIIFFLVIRVIFFRPVLAGLTDEQKSETVGAHLTELPYNQ